jgi:molybdenum cofactor cytidylyltransferase
MGRAFAIVPAAGHSLRMGQPKLLMPLEGRPLIAHVLEAWRQGGVERIAVVVRADDPALATAIRSLAISKVDIVEPEIPPPDMKASIQAALRHLEANCSPGLDDCFLVAPADMPRLSPGIVRALVAEHIQKPGQIVVPTMNGKPGHPVLFPWKLAPAVHGLGPGEGINGLVERGPVVFVACDHLAENDTPFADVDTPEEYRRLAGE